MNNKDAYKKVFDSIHASDKLKQETLEKAMNAGKVKRFKTMKVLALVAVFVLVIVAGINNRQVKIDPSTQIAINDTNIKLNDNDDLPRFSNIEELRSALVESRQTNGLHFDSFEGFESTIQSTVTKGDVAVNDSLSSDLMGSTESSTQDKFLTNNDYSTTNNQVANVDEADIVKTDGEYIYYVQNNKVYIIKADTLEELSNISLAEDKEERFYPREIFINKDKLVVLGTHYTYEYDKKELDDVYYDYAYSFSKSKAKALIYSIKDKKDLKLEREVALDGDYVQARMIGDNVYFISRKGIRYYKTMRDIEVLPIVYDSYVSSNDIVVDCKRIVHFPEVESNTYTLVGGFNINNDEGMSVETFLGAGETIYASEEHLYITHENFGESYYNRKTTIYKFDLDEGSIKLETKGEIDGYLNNQFSMDEHKGYLRLATTVYIDDEIRTEKKNARTGAISVEIDTQKITANNLYVLNEDLKVVGKIENLAKDEKIYSARFIGDLGYVVTFKQIDPLFVIDLSNPANPEVKGALKIPGYSSYLHPYDETHIIGIGYNTKDNGWGGVTNDNMKMSMFDVSDLENPKEIFSVDIGDGYTYSEISYNHKALFYNKDKNLIGFPLRESGRAGIVIYKINLDSGEFEDYGKIMYKNRYYDTIERMIYIKDELYTLSSEEIVSYDLLTFEKLNSLVLD